jgi:hypothetical protein
MKSVVYINLPKAGLGNKLVVLARGFVFAKKNNLSLRFICKSLEATSILFLIKLNRVSVLENNVKRMELFGSELYQHLWNFINIFQQKGSNKFIFR